MTLNKTIESIDLEKLLSYDNEEFIRNAYSTILKRNADTDGLKHYSKRLNAGVDKLDIIHQLISSKEAISKNITIEGTDNLVAKYKKQKNFFFKSLYESLISTSLHKNKLSKIDLLERKINFLDKYFNEKITVLNDLVKQSYNSINKIIKVFDSLTTVTPSKLNDSIQIERDLSPIATQEQVDSNWYLEQYPDVAQQSLSPEEHYNKCGKIQCRIPRFDQEWYLEEYPDVASAGIDPYKHFITNGKNEGRHPFFNTYWYISEYADIAAAGINPYEHYVQYGKNEGRYPAFDRNWYLKQYPDVAAAGVDPYEHYFYNGKYEGRHPAYHVKNINRKSYTNWISEYDTLNENMRTGMVESIKDFLEKPLISIIMPVYNPNTLWLKEAIDSVRNQLYQNWELCIADDASTNLETRPCLESYSKKDSRIKVIFRETNGHISAASNSALSLASGKWIALLDHDDLIPEHALFWVVDSINKNPNGRMIYSDDDQINEEGLRSNPYFKCEWNQDLFYSHNLFGHLGVYYTELVREVGAFKVGMDGSQDYDLALRCLEKIKPSQIIHIPRILYHWRVHAESTAFSSDAKPYAMIAGGRAIDEHFARQGIDAKTELLGYAYRTIYALPKKHPLVSLIIPTRNGLDVLRQCIASILEKTTYSNYEIIIVDNASDDPETIEYLKTISQTSKVRVLHDNRPFNYSAINNAAVASASGEIIGLINNDIEVISPDWLSEMVSHAVRPGVGAVGARLWYPNNTLQHGGVILGIGGAAGHSHKGLSRDGYGYSNRAVVTQSYSAVTAACLIIRKSIYEKIGGLDEINLAIAYNDVDFCIRLREAGYKNIWTPYAELYHHESATRGHEDTPQKKSRLAAEMSFLKNTWGSLLLNDPSYSPNLTLESEDFGLAWPPRTQSNENFLTPFSSEFQEDVDFAGCKTEIKAITFYLPQFHTCKQNDAWWGKDFTEWTNAKQAKPQFPGHYQPREPHDDIGYYDLSDVETMRKQAKLAKAHGIYGFCFYHYWFSGDRVLEKPVDLLLKNQNIDLKFFLCWANENWTRTWDGLNKDILLEQKYLKQDPVNFIKDISKYLDDPRYIRIDNKPVLIVYKTHAIPNAAVVFEEWRSWWKQNRNEELLIWCTRTDNEDTAVKKIKNSIDAVVEFPPAITPYSIETKRLKFKTSGYFHNYQQMVSDITSGTETVELPSGKFYRSVMLGWDNSARRKNGWSNWFGFSLDTYYKWLTHTVNYTRKTFVEDERFIFINAWNEWAEGTYLEPDKKYGYASINTTSRAIFGLPLSNSTKENISLDDDRPLASHTDTSQGITLPSETALAIVIHSFYIDVFNEIIGYLNKIKQIPFHLYVTCPLEHRETITSTLKNNNYKHTILTVENKGRDVLPFLEIMKKVRVNNHSKFLKIHTKKTEHRNNGEQWRDDLFDQLLSNTSLTASLDYLEFNKHVGILGPVGHVIPMRDYYGSNRERVESISKKLGVSLSILDRLDFVAGTMFVGRIAAVLPLLNLNLKNENFEIESMQTDGTLAHAIERALSASAYSAGLTVTSMSKNIDSDYDFAAKTLFKRN